MKEGDLHSTALFKELDIPKSVEGANHHDDIVDNQDISSRSLYIDDDMTADPKMVDSMLAQELTRMSMTEREAVYFQIHGVLPEIEESPEMIKRSIDALQKELSAIEEKPAYLKALAIDPSYVNDPKFQLMFLRAERFETKEAAQRMVRFFDLKLELFGRMTTEARIRSRN